MNGAAQGNQMGYASEPKQELPLLDYATQEIQRLTADIAHEIANLNGFVDGVRGARPELMASNTTVTYTGGGLIGLGQASVTLKGNLMAPPNRGDSLREAIRSLQILRNDVVEAVSRLQAI